MEERLKTIIEEGFDEPKSAFPHLIMGETDITSMLEEDGQLITSIHFGTNGIIIKYINTKELVIEDDKPVENTLTIRYDNYDIGEIIVLRPGGFEAITKAMGDE